MYDSIEFEFKTSTPAQIAAKYGVPVEVAATPESLREHLLAAQDAFDKEIQEKYGSIENVRVTPLEFVERRSEYGYKITPRGSYVYIRPAPLGHAARSIFPTTEVTDQEIGWIHASLVPDLVEGALVSYDKFSAIGGGMNVVDESGDPVFVVMIDQQAVTSLLERVHVRNDE